jgi:hypothetical protein
MNIASLYAQVHIEESTVVGEHCGFCYPKEASLRGGHSVICRVPIQIAT